MADSDSEDVPTLPADTLALLKEFQQEQLKKLEKLDSGVCEEDGEANDIEIDEDWQLSQFWYDNHTAEVLAKEAARCAGEGGKIALISCPTLYQPLLKFKGPNTTVNLLEFDRRFSVYGDRFIYYDYNCPLELPPHMAKSFDLVVADPPFLSEECLTKVATTIHHLSKDKIILCTGVVMKELAEALLGLKKCQFTPHHKNNLGNEFGCFANYTIDDFLECSD